MQELLQKIKQGFSTLAVAADYQDRALINIEQWLNNPDLIQDVAQIEYLAETEKWDILLDSFYQVIPFGTGGRRGLVGIGTNRINAYTIRSSAQGHAQYLLEMYTQVAKERGVVISYDVREYLVTGIYDDNKPCSVRGLSCKDLAFKAAEVYLGNGIKVYLFAEPTSTPELSFQVRNLNAVAGDMISASHNPPEYNGKKVVDAKGGQLIPPHDELLVNKVVNEVTCIKHLAWDEAVKQGLARFVTPEEHEQYVTAARSIDIGSYSGVRILFSPFHATAITSVFPVLKSLGFDVQLDPQSSVMDPKFSSIMFNIPNPEVPEAYKNLIPEAENISADLIIVADPDGDRIGLMSKEQNEWRFFNGNEIFILAVAYMLEELKHQNKLKPSNVIAKTIVTTGFIDVLAKKYGVSVNGDLLVGIKYIADVMNKLEAECRITDFLIGGEESHGSVAGNYVRDKDTCAPAILLARLASREKSNGRTLGVYLDCLYKELGYFDNYLSEIRLPGAEGMSKIAKIQTVLRETKPQTIGRFKVLSMKDYWQGEPFLSETDKVSRNVIVFDIEPVTDTKKIKVTIRPSGTEPKTKIYIETAGDIGVGSERLVQVRTDIEKDFMLYFYKILGIDFPERGFLLFGMLPLNDKLKYFEIEPQIAALKDIADKDEKTAKLNELLKFLGVDPMNKIDKAFKAEYGQKISEYLNIN